MERRIPRDQYGFPILVWGLSDKPYKIESWR